MDLIAKIKNKSVAVGIIGMGYVGLPLGLAFADKKVNVLGFDLDNKKINMLNKGKGYLKHISNNKIKKAVHSGYLRATSDFTRLKEVDAIIICVPTPLTEHREPDMSFVKNTSETISKYLRKGQLVVLESTTYPGTTREVLLPLFGNANGKNKFKAGKDFYLAFSPEREDPNNPEYTTSQIPKVVGGLTPQCLKVAKALYDLVIIKTVPVSSPDAAEATKLLENIYRSVNIALVNELKMVFDKMKIDIWEVIAAASTKPFGFKPFYPGPGLGGHCIPIDPFYLTWKAREFEINTKFIELAGEINTQQPYYVVAKSAEALNKFKKALNNAKILILGAAYKKDIDDMRESPSLKLIELFQEKGAIVDYYDPLVPVLPKTRKYNLELKSIKLTKEKIMKYDLVVLSTDHSIFDYKFIASNAKLILDSRNAFETRRIKSTKIIKT
ncbi:MAG: nucleotide sugar dehydrogenase [Ignavibacteriae bacterium]|nr:MAG: nucleotide sugar dehydrogenase [Chlorobiota bacterium]MBE7475294.1 nucleotide sugar dehydrogenase [Ignavibacteriales bacterium]MBL1122261.1 nucleotide sugar dehydrogenase [Ignavibacteriota bacterium]MCE7855416.1 nucleotide sugar dehydrogenase [Ignavibacteria bacterium CHB3]NUM62869.1 nucleotide sugar dehydrogenase [Ignavibacteriaceae bacterium]